jgi:hypothetical protein
MGRNTRKHLTVAHNRDDALAVYQAEKAAHTFGSKAAFLFSFAALLSVQSTSPVPVPATVYCSFSTSHTSQAAWGCFSSPCRTLPQRA